MYSGTGVSPVSENMDTGETPVPLKTRLNGSPIFFSGFSHTDSRGVK